MTTATKGKKEVTDIEDILGFSIGGAYDDFAADDLELAGEEGEVPLPTLQASKYNLDSSKDEISLFITEASVAMLDPREAAEMKLTPKSLMLGESETDGYVVENARWVILARPKTNFAENKDIQRIVRTQRGFQLGNGWNSAARVHMACLMGNRLLRNPEGGIQIFQLKLGSLRGKWINGSDIDLTMDKLNNAIKRKLKLTTKGVWPTRFVSTEVAPYPYRFESKTKNQSSLRPMFGFVPGGKVEFLSPENKQLISELAASDEFKELIENPFGAVETVSSASEVENEFAVDETDEAMTSSEEALDDIDF